MERERERERESMCVSLHTCKRNHFYTCALNAPDKLRARK